jgi:hypothetical protein
VSPDSQCTEGQKDVGVFNWNEPDERQITYDDEEKTE